MVMVMVRVLPYDGFACSGFAHRFIRTMPRRTFLIRYLPTHLGFYRTRQSV
jgi:hypothetical protein